MGQSEEPQAKFGTVSLSSLQTRLSTSFYVLFIYWLDDDKTPADTQTETQSPQYYFPLSTSLILPLPAGGVWLSAVARKVAPVGPMLVALFLAYFATSIKRQQK